MVSTELKTIKIAPVLFGRNNWQLSDESDEEEGAVPPAGSDLDIDDEEDDELDLSDDKFEEE